LLAILFATFLAIGRIGAIGSIGHTEATGQPNQIANQLDSASANWDLATWISKLDTPPEAITKSDASALANSSVHWTSVSIASRLVQEQPEQALRYAVLQRSAAERISTKIDTRHMPLARELMTNAIKLLKALRQCHPNDSSLLRELIATHHRLTNRMAQAHRIQSGYLAVCEACMKRFPDHPNLYLARSEAYLQAWKNELRNDDEKTAFESLLKSYADSRRALELAPNNPLAYHQVSDRLKRITRFQTEHSSLSDIAMIRSGPSSSLPQ